MKNALRFGIVLGLICIAAGLGVSGVYQLTKGRIAEKKEKSFRAALTAVFPEADSFSPLGGEGDVSWEGQGVGVARVGKRVLGYLAVGEKQGYSSVIRVLVGCEANFRIKAVRILSQSETPGLGERTKEVKSDRTVWQAVGEAVGGSSGEESGGEVRPWFQAQFDGRGAGDLVVVKGKTETEIEAITGATVSSQAVTDAVKAALDAIGRGVSGGAGAVGGE